VPFLLTIKNWVSRFRTGHLSTEGEEHSGRPTQLTIPGNVDAIHSMILGHITFHAKMIEETSREKVGYIIHQILDMRKLVHSHQQPYTSYK
jgi:transposase